MIFTNNNCIGCNKCIRECPTLLAIDIMFDLPSDNNILSVEIIVKDKKLFAKKHCKK